MARKRLGEILIQAGALDESRLRVALQEQQRWGGPLGRILIETRLVREDDLVRALSVQFNLPAVNLAKPISKEALMLLSLEYCEEHALIPLGVEGKFFDVGLCDPTNLSVLDEIRILTKLNVRPQIIGPKQLERALAKYYKGMPLDLTPSNTSSIDPGTVAALSTGPQPAPVNREPRPPDLFPDVNVSSPRPSAPAMVPTQPQRPSAPVMSQRPSAPAPVVLGAPSLVAPQIPQVTQIPGAPMMPPPSLSQQGMMMPPPSVSLSGMQGRLSQPPPPPAPIDPAAFEKLQQRVTQLESMMIRDKAMLRKLMAMLIETKLLTREQILSCIND